jgi:hypothetical protein
MSSLGEVQRIIGLSLNKIQMGRNQRGGLPLHKNLLVATVLNKARDVYMQETMYMNYRLMACGQFNQETQDDMDEDDTPETEDYEEDSESDVEEDGDTNSKKEYVAQNILPCLAAAAAAASQPSPVAQPCLGPEQELLQEPVPVTSNPAQGNSDEGFIDESDCDCDTRNFCQDAENRVPFQYCFNCAPFHPSNGRGPTLVGPQSSTTCVLPNPVSQEQEDKLIYDMDSKSTRNQSGQTNLKRKRLISSEETQDAITSILPKKKKKEEEEEEKEEEEGEDLNDSGFQEESEVFHPAFRGHRKEVEQITSLVSIFSFGQQLFNSQDCSAPTQPAGKKRKEDEDSDSDSDTSSDSGHSSDDHENNSDDKSEERRDELQLIPDLANRINNSELRCSPQDGDLEVSGVGVTATV